MTKTIKRFILIVIANLCFMQFSHNVAASEYDVFKITDNYKTARYPSIHNGQIAWWECAGSDCDVFFYDGIDTIELSNNFLSDRSADVYNGQVAWWSRGSGDAIYFYDGSEIVALTGYVTRKGPSKLHNGQVVWYGYDGTGQFADSEIYLYNGLETIQLTDNESFDAYPKINNSQVVWQGFDGHDDEIYLYKGTALPIQLTNNNYLDTDPQIDNGQVVWQGYNGSSYSIYFYNGTKTTQLPNNGQYVTDPKIHNGQIVWRAYDGHDFEIYLYDGEKIVQLTDNGYRDEDVQIHNGQVIWKGYSGGSDSDIYLYDGTDTFKLTNGYSFDREPQIHNAQIAFRARDDKNYQIFLSKIATEIRDGKDFSVGTKISDDPERLASGGERVEGVVVDGVTRLLLRLRVLDPDQPITITLDGTGNEKEDGILRTIDGLQEGSTITVDTVNTERGDLAFAIYQAPENFVRDNYEAVDKTLSERTLPLIIETTYTIKDGEILDRREKQIRILRPPLILVHGLWSSAAMWKDFQDMLRNKIPDIYILRVDYKDTNASYFDVNKDVLNNNIELARNVLLVSKKVAMVQADVMGHSMGGILSRIHYQGEMWAERPVYKQDINYNMGNINKFISLDSVHFGSYLADFALDFKDSLPPVLQNLFLWSMRNKKMPIDDGAVESLRTLSPPIVYMNSIFTEPKPRSHAIVGDYVSHIELTEIPGYMGDFFKIIKRFETDTTIPFQVPGSSDLVVSAESQAGGMTPPTLSTFDHLHTAAANQNVEEKTIELLNEDLDSFSFENGFPINLYP